MVFTSRLFKRRLSRKAKKAKRKSRKQRGGNVLDGRMIGSKEYDNYLTNSDTPDFMP